MPTILRFDGLRAVIYLNDHRPAHVHIIGKGGEAVFDLNCPSGSIMLREKYCFSTKELKHIMSVLITELQVLCTKWGEYHDYY